MRYYTVKIGWVWHVKCGTGTRSLFRSLFWRKTELIASQLNCAFLDGRFVGK